MNSLDTPSLVRWERALLGTFPPLEQAEVAGLFVGASKGVTGRANSACALGPTADTAPTTVDAVEQWYRSRGLVPQFRVTPLLGDDVKAELDRRGYTGAPSTAEKTIAMALSRIPPGDDATGTTAQIEEQRPHDWAVLSDRSASDDAVIEDMLQRGPSAVAWATVRRIGEPVAIGRCVVADTTACLQALATHPEHRRQGLGAGVVRSLHRWAAGNGAQSAFLHVLQDNPAVSLYESFGYRPIYRYYYRAAVR